MGCLSHRRKQVELRAEQKWDYINLKDFRSKGCGRPSAYVYLWFLLIISVAVYAIDTLTAINLLAFNQWSSEIKPPIDLLISKWVFCACIILSFLNLGYEGFRAWRVMKRGNIAECYLDSLAVRWESIRFGKGQGWRRFLVFAELTKNKKGAEYIALFTYFSLQSWIRVLVCSGPRQVINAFTLKSVYESDLLTIEDNAGASLSTFFSKLKVLAEKDYRQAAILSGMLFTLVVWVFSLLFFVFAIIFYVTFLFHWIPRADGGLTGYCERKVNDALLKIVSDKVNKALAREDETRWKTDTKSAKKKNGGEKPTLNRAATLPTIPDVGFGDTDKLPEMPMLSRAETMNTTSGLLPAYTSRPPSAGDYVELGLLDQKRPLPSSRANTMNPPAPAYSSRVSLLASAADMEHSSPSPPPPPPFPPPLSPPARTGTSNTMRSAGSASQPRGPNRMMSNGSGAESFSFTRELTETPKPFNESSSSAFSPPPMRSMTGQRSIDSYSSRPTNAPRPAYPPGERSGFGSSPVPYMQQVRGRARDYAEEEADSHPSRHPPRSNTFQPLRSATNPMASREPAYPPQRSFTGPMLQAPRQPSSDYYGRQPMSQGSRGTPDTVNQDTPFDFDLESQRGYRI